MIKTNNYKIQTINSNFGKSILNRRLSKPSLTKNISNQTFIKNILDKKELNSFVSNKVLNSIKLYERPPQIILQKPYRENDKNISDFSAQNINQQSNIKINGQRELMKYSSKVENLINSIHKELQRQIKR